MAQEFDESEPPVFLRTVVGWNLYIHYITKRYKSRMNNLLVDFF